MVIRAAREPVRDDHAREFVRDEGAPFPHVDAKGLLGVDARLRADILAELGNHLSDAVAEAGGDAGAALAGMQAPKEFARQYRELYGYGTPFKVLFAALAVLLAIPTVTMPWMAEFAAVDPSFIPAIFILVTALYLIGVSVAAGKIVGALSGAAACVARFVVLGGLLLAGGAVVDDGGLGLLGFAAVSLALVLIGYLPGDRKEKWTRGEVSL